jgi:hypothetical protein
MTPARARGLFVMVAAVVAVFGTASAASADPGELATPAPPPARGSIIDVVNDFTFCADVVDSSHDWMYPAPGYLFFDCMRGGSPG